MKINVVEVGARDGLQNEKAMLSVDERIEFITKLADCGLKHIEVGGFVSPDWVPQMRNSDQVTDVILSKSKYKNVKFSALVPNEKGMLNALKTNIKHIAIFGACSETFSKKNINCSIDESFEKFKKVMALAKKNKILVRGYLSTVFGCPYEGNISQKKAIELITRMYKLGVYEVSVGDTIGVATPLQIKNMIKALKKKVPLSRIAMHFHDTRGTALANVLMSLQLGIKTFDSSIGGLGGCPYAKGAMGNLGTEDLVYMLNGMGYDTEIDLTKLIETKKWVEGKVGHALPSHVGQAGLPLVGTLNV